MLDHVSVQCASVPASAAFYDAVLAPLGGVRVMDFGEVVGYGDAGAPRVLDRPAEYRDRFPRVPSGLHGRHPRGRAGVLRGRHRTGAEVLHEPRLWPEYHASYYGAFVRDPDGNNVEAVCHTPG